MKFEKIKEVIYSSDCNRISDHSGSGKSYVGRNRPLWMILENKRLDLRIWVTKDFGSLSITTTKLSAPLNSIEYYESNRQYPCKSQGDMVARLQEIFAGERVAA